MRRPVASVTYYTLLVSTLLLLVLGLSMVFSVQSVSVAARGGNPFLEFARYLFFALVGVGGMMAISRAPLRVLRAVALPVLGASILLQLMVFVPGVRYCAGGNCNWIRIPLIGTAQPSEMIKLALALYLGWVVATQREALVSRRRRVLVALPVVAAIALVLGGKDLGTVIILCLEVGGALWLVGVRARWFVLMGGAGLLLFGAFTLLSANRRGRILAWLNPDGADPLGISYQPLHARYALGTGGWGGVGPGASRQKWGYLTQADSDYVFAVLGEELGVVGTVTVIALFVVVGWCCLRLMRRCDSLYVTVVTGAIGCWIVGQALVNMSVVVGLLPVLGVPLPLISAGGSALVFVLGAIGVLLSFARREPGAPEVFSTRSGAARRTLATVASSRRNRA